tara:strand:- start:1140 stop:1574 length:435 start_codon:yes stop_codon:yes gene_type:complete
MKKIFLLLFIFFVNNVSAQDNFLSLKNNKVNVRYGPGFDYQVKYIYKKLNLPVKIIDKKENFRRIIDIKNNSGWVHISQLKKTKSLITLVDKIIFKKPSLFSKPIIKIKKGRLLIVKKCEKKWCRVQTENYMGWIEINDVWGSY